ncbi:MAG: FAD-dependent oxidoreductase, partial [Micrococcales bacterium]|nr:FAD-dependent oxidoreductase [Micrococcales bacterium]
MRCRRAQTSRGSTCRESTTRRPSSTRPPLPQRLAIIGGGFIGLEFAQMFQHFGSQVTVLDSGEQFLRRAEPVVAESVHQVLTKSGVLVRQSARVQQIRQDGEALTLELADGQVQADGGVLEPLPPLMADEDVV